MTVLGGLILFVVGILLGAAVALDFTMGRRRR